MKKLKKITLNKILLCLLTPLMCVSLALGITFSNKSADAMTSYPWSPSLEKELFNYDTFSYNKDALDDLARAVLDKFGDSNTTITSLISNIKEKSKTHGRPVDNKNITVSYGRYRLTGGTQTSALVWMPVYMSTNRSGDAILTLYLAATGGPASGQEVGGFTNFDLLAGNGVGQYTDQINCGAPSNMYGYSFIRSNTLGNQSKYTSYKTNHSADYTVNNGATLESTSSHKYLDFQTYNEGKGPDAVASMGYMYEDLATPSEMLWQSYQSYAEFIGESGVITNGKGDGVEGGGADWANYCFPNDAYDAPRSYTKPNGTTSTSMTPVYNNANFDYKTKPQYTDWQNDKVWLPSLTEVGTANWDGSGEKNLNGLWQLTANQRGNAGNAGASWLRTANTAYNMDGAGYSTYSMFCCEEDGSIGTHSLKEVNLAIRPAIHLNLDKAYKKINPPVALPEVVEAPYVGEEIQISDSYINVPSAEKWYVKNKMHVGFFPTIDCNLKDELAALNAGTYYMKVTLETADLYFAKAPLTQRSKVVKLEVKKAPLGVKWVYQNNRATALKLVEGKIYDWDKKIGLAPEISITYESATGQGTRYYDFNDLLRDTYFGYGFIKDSDKYNYNYELYDVDNPDLVDKKTGEHIVKSDSFAVGRKVLKVPYFLDHEGENEIQLDYAGEQFVQLVLTGKDEYFDINVTSELGVGKAEELGVSDEGYLVFKVTERDTYTFSIRFANNDQFTWFGSEYDWDKNNNDTGADYTERKLTVNIVRAKIDVEYVNLPAEWNTITNVTFRLDVRGIYGLTGSDTVKMGVYYLDQNNKRTNLTAEADGTYRLRNMKAGEYTMYATLADENYTENYYMDPSFKLQRFKVVQTVSSLSDNDIKWQYTHDGNTSPAFGFADHDSEETALIFDFDDKFYLFSLTLDELTLHDKYYVKAKYEGDAVVKDAGMHCVTVYITAFYKNVQFDDKEYKVYFKINPMKFDLSDLEWDYDMSNPPVYNGATKKIQLTADSLAKYEGLTAKYVCDGDATGAGNYVTTVNFLLSGTYAVNYVLPVATDLDSFDGEFAFTCEWLIAKAKISVEWNEMTDDGSSGLVFVPTLKTGAEYVDYIYEHKEADGSWVPTENLVADGANETYRAKAVIKAAYAGNYELVNDVPKEFQVASGKRPVIVHFEYKGETVADGAEFPYSGTPLELSLKVDGIGLAVKEYSFKYYSLDNGRTELPGAPTEVGAYAAVVTAKYGTDTYVSNESSTEIEFSIVKADFDLSQIFWIYEHGSKIVAAKFDISQGKWVNESGEEVLFSFEYDGTPHILKVSCLQEFANPEIDYLKVSTLRGNSATDASDSSYTALVTFDYNTDHYNSPADAGFPMQLTWGITKKQIDFNKVRWGYLDKDGNERSFDFEHDSFQFTRDENGVVGITVQLIGLPQGVQSLISYKTQNLSEEGAPSSEGNTRSAIGEYLTSFTISGTWSDSNYVDFDSKDFPVTIPQLCTWQIVRRELSKIDYQDGFATFDDRVHNVIELCNIPEEDLYYIAIDITFVDSTGVNVIKNYAGYDDVENMLYHAGTYDIRVYELVGEEETPIIWDYVRIIVAKNELHVYWDEGGSYPVARVKSIYATDMVGTKYYNSKDAEVPLAYVRSTRNEDFYAKACVTEAYERNIDIIVDGDEKVYFTYHPYDPNDFDDDPTVLEFPVMVNERMEYTGNPLRFEIDAWDTYYSKYLYISDGELEQTAVGEYHVLLRFKKDANAYWMQPAEDEDYNRNSYLITFFIDPPTRWALDYPIIENKSVEWTGNTIEFKVINWVTISKYVDYVVKKNGEQIGDQTTFRNGVFTFKDGGTYTITFFIPDGSIGYWVSNPDADTEPYSIQIMINGDPDNPVDLPYPVLNKTTSDFTGSAQQFKINDWNVLEQYVDVTVSAGATFANGTFIATNVGTYEIKFKIKDGAGITFVEGIKEYTLSFSITPGNVPGAEINYPVLSDTKLDYNDGKELSIYIKDWTMIYSNYLILSCDNPAVRIEGGTIYVSAAGKYEITVKFKDGVDAKWVTTGDQAVYTLSFEVIRESKPGEAFIPKFENGSDKIQYNGKDITFQPSYFDEENAAKFEIVSGSFTQREVGKYEVILRLKSGFTWDDGTTDDIKLSFEITKAKFPDGSHIGVDDSGKPIIVDKDGKPLPDFDFDFGDLVDVEFKDKDGNVVKKEDLVPGESYTVTIKVKDETKFDASIENGSSIRDEINDKNNNGGYPINGYKPPVNDGDDDNGDGGFNSLWWIAIVAGALAVVAILGVIIALATRRGDDDYDDDYDDYDDDYDDDDDDYDDDYDDYDEY